MALRQQAALALAIGSSAHMTCASDSRDVYGGYWLAALSREDVGLARCDGWAMPTGM